MEDPGGFAQISIFVFHFYLKLKKKMCSQESNCRRRIMAPLGTEVGQAGSRVENMVDGKGALTAMMVDDNAEEKYFMQSRRKHLAIFCPNKEGRILCLLDCVEDGPIIIYL